YQLCREIALFLKGARARRARSWSLAQLIARNITPARLGGGSSKIVAAGMALPGLPNGAVAR
ncbi:MAG: hypothetical protein NZ739_09700, partial [Verrucomicrobiae bacterium]|nr:hypothetical protein [Verrucomicrobiae bacterium]